jgi:hypothetical protein
VNGTGDVTPEVTSQGTLDAIFAAATEGHFYDLQSRDGPAVDVDGEPATAG